MQRVLNQCEKHLMEQIMNPNKKFPRAGKIIISFLESYKYATMRQLGIECGYKNYNDVNHILYVLEMIGIVQRIGNLYRDTTKRPEIVWGMSNQLAKYPKAKDYIWD